MATENNPSRLRRKIHISGDGEYQEEFISRKAIQTHDLVILEPIYTNIDYFKALFFPDKNDLILMVASVITMWLLQDFIGISIFHPSALVFIGIFGIFFFTTRFAYFSVGDLFTRIQKSQNPHRLVNDLDFDFNFWGLFYNLALIAIGSYLIG